MNGTGSFPYPATVTVDRHGGDAGTKMLFCYAMDNHKGIVGDSGKIMEEERGFGGTVINPAGVLFGGAGSGESDSGESGFGGVDGGTGGCGCGWQNWVGVVGG